MQTQCRKQSLAKSAYFSSFVWQFAKFFRRKLQITVIYFSSVRRKLYRAREMKDQSEIADLKK
jgi:hypothetical protein